MFKTNVPNGVASIDEAKKLLVELHANGEQYHPEDDAHLVCWGRRQRQCANI